MKTLIVKLSPIDGLNSSMIRTLALTKGLLSLGHKIDLITIPLSLTHTQTGTYDFMKNVNVIKAQNNSLYDNIISKSHGGIKSLLVKTLRKMYHKYSLYNYTNSIAKNIDISILNSYEYDIVISVSDPKTSHLAVHQLIQQGLKYKRWIQYWGDPMSIDITKKSIYPKWVIKNIEKRILRDADKTVYVSPFTLEKQKIMFPNFASKMRFLPIPYITTKYYEKPKNDRFTIGYFGAYPSKVRNILPLYEAGIEMQGIIKLNIVGDSNITLEQKSNINIFPRGNVSQFEKDTDLLVCMLNSSGTQIPGKIYHYAATNKPILVLLDGERKREMKSYLETYNRYIICENNVKSIVATVKEIMGSAKEFQPCESFNPKLIANKLISTN